MKRGAVSFFLALVLCAGLLPGSARAAEDVAALHARSNGNPYYIMVNRKQSTVTVYSLDENGYYTVPVKAMICSTGSSEHMTPRGNFSIGKRFRWNLMMGGVYAQYVTQFYGACLFHSVCYSRPEASAMLKEYYNNLGRPASHGCVRLQTVDAKWIYENCAAGTLVTVYDGNEPGALGKPERMVDALTAENHNGWDPTEPDEANPWSAMQTKDITLSADTLHLAVGAYAPLTVARTPENTLYPPVDWSSDDSRVAVVTGAGWIRATGVGTTVVRAVCGGIERCCSVTVTETGLPFLDVPGSDRYYGDIQYLYERGVVTLGAKSAFFPESYLTCNEALQMLYNLTGRPDAGSAQSGRAWYEDARDWASDSGLLPPWDGAIGDPLTVRDMLELLFRYEGALYPERMEVSFRGGSAGPGAVILWTALRGLLPEDGSMSWESTITRAEAASLVHRYCDVSGI